MILTVEISAEAEVAIKELAVQNGCEPEEYAGELLAQQAILKLAQTNGNDKDDSRFFTRALTKMRARTPAEIVADREKMFRLATPPRPLPKDKSVFDVVFGKLHSENESDAQVFTALKKLS